MEKQETQHQRNHITNSFLLKIKGQEIACIVCKKDVVISFAEDEVLPGYGPFNLIAPIYVSYSGDDGDGVKPRISIDKKYLGEEPLQILRNFRVFVSHEASHIYMTEIAKWRRWHRNDPVKAIIANLIEDQRCNNFLINRYPGLKRDFATYFSNSFLHHHNLQDVPEEFRFATALVQYTSFRRAKGDLSTLRESQREKILSVIALLDGIKWACLFERDLLPCAEEIHRLIASELKGHNLETGLSFIQNSISDEAIEENQQKCEAKAKPVEDADLNSLGLRALEISGEGKSDFIDKVRQEFSQIYGISLEPTAVETKLIDDIFGSDASQGPLNLKKMREDRIKCHFSKNPLDIMLPLENLDFYYQCKGEIQHQIKCLTSAFQSIKQAEDWDENYLSGQNLAHDFLQRLLNDDRHLFKRYIEKDYDTKWLILTDVSSSVKASEVTRLTIILSEVANTVFNRNDFCMCAFSNNFYVIKDFNEGYDKTVKSRIGGMYSGGTTNICDSIDFCVNRFEKFPSETKVLLVITDGEPNTCGSKDPREHTKAAVKRAFANDVFTIGIGTHDNIGIQKYFPIGFTIDSFDSFPRLFLGIMAKVLFEPEAGISRPPG